MDRKGAAAMLSIMQVAYPRFYAQQGKEQMHAAVCLWADALAVYPDEAVKIALNRVIKESPYPPTIADIVQRIEAMTNIGNDDAEALWQKLVTAICDGHYHAEERYAVLPYVCQRFVGSPKELRAMAQTDEDILHTVTRGQFMKRVENLRQQEKVMQETPKHVLDLLNGMVAHMQALPSENPPA